MQLSIIIPLYNEEPVIFELDRRLKNLFNLLFKKFNLNRESIEVIFINDGSGDNTLALLLNIKQDDSCYKVLNFSRNFGHQIAITAGLEYAGGEAVVIMDGDLQDPPEFIVNLYQKYLEGFDVVSCIRKSRAGESLFKILTAKVFYKCINYLSSFKIPADTGDFKLISARVVRVLKNMKEKHRFMRGMIGWVGFRQTSLEYDRDERYAGKSKYPLKKMLKFAVDAITSFSSAPLRLVTYLGFIFAVFGFVGIILILYLKIFTTHTVSGWSSIMLTVLIMGGINLITLGVMGEYIARINEETKNRPLYIVEHFYQGPSN